MSSSPSLTTHPWHLTFEDAEVEAAFCAQTGRWDPATGSGHSAATVVAIAWLAGSLAPHGLAAPLCLLVPSAAAALLVLLAAALLLLALRPTVGVPMRPLVVASAGVAVGLAALQCPAAAAAAAAVGPLETLVPLALLFATPFAWSWSLLLALLCDGAFLAASLLIRPEVCSLGPPAAPYGAVGRIAGTLACVALAADAQRRERAMYRVQRQLEALCCCVAEGGPEGCSGMLEDPTLSSVVRRTIHVVVAQGRAAAEAVTALASNAQFIPSSPADCFALKSEGRQPSAMLDLGTGGPWLRTKPGTLLLCSLPQLAGADTATAYDNISAFLEEVVASVKEYHGVIHSIGAEEVTVCWNLFQFHPTHQSEACHCALNIQTRVSRRLGKACHMVVASAHFVVGMVHVPPAKVALLHGRFLHVARRLLQLNDSLHCGILVTESVHEAVQGSLATLSLDHVQPECLDHPIKLYGLLPRPAFIAPRDDLYPYKQGFSCLLEGDFEKAQHHLRDFLTRAGSDVAPFAERLLGLAACKATAATDPDSRFIRGDGWESDPIPETPLIITTDLDPEDAADDAVVPLRRLSSLPPARTEPDPEIPRSARRSSGEVWRGPDASSQRVRLLSPTQLLPTLPPSSILQRRGMAQPPAVADGHLRASVPTSRRASLQVLESFIMGEGPVLTRTPSRRLSTWSSNGSVEGDLLSDGGEEPLPAVGKAIPFTTTNQKLWYCTDTLLGAGGFGGVYLGMSEEGLLVAIKQMETAPEKNAQLLNEIKLLSKFQHNHIVAYLGSAVVGPHVMVVMECAPISLGKVLACFGSLQLTCAKRYTRDITRGLRYLHSNDVIHRDIKPANVLIGQTGFCKLADFGTAALLHKVEQGGDALLIGTPHYMAPETVRGQVGREADVWALGVTLWEMLTGTLLDDAQQMTNPTAVMFWLGMMTDAPQIPHEISSDARGFLESCLRLDPAARATAPQLLNHPFLL